MTRKTRKPPPDDPLADFTERDKEELQILVNKHTAEVVASAAKVLTTRGRGRKPEGIKPILRRMEAADWIEQRAAEYRREGKRAPYKHAEHDYREEVAKDTVQIETIKKKRLKGRSAMDMVLNTLIRVIETIDIERLKGQQRKPKGRK